MLRLRDLPGLVRHAPASWRDRPVHYDPDLTSPVPTYGDNCRRAGRAYALRRAEPGDTIVFLARLWNGAPAFHLVGELAIVEVLPDLTADPGPGWWDDNAHVRRARAGAGWDSFWVFRGGPGSRLYDRALPFDRQAAERLFSHESWDWPPHRTELQVIGSHTRAVRRLP
jgi:putative DNA base modification enzyme with NMAD domain